MTLQGDGRGPVWLELRDEGEGVNYGAGGVREARPRMGPKVLVSCLIFIPGEGRIIERS